MVVISSKPAVLTGAKVERDNEGGDDQHDGREPIGNQVEPPLKSHCSVLHASSYCYVQLES